jgi:probable rRNA maturation factor
VRAFDAEPFAPLLRRCVRLAVKNERLPFPCMADVFLVTNTHICAVNKERRGVDKVTDVLSFPALNPGEKPFPDPGNGRVFLGDILIACDQAVIQARKNRHSVERELGYLAAHGALHLMGYEHETEWDRAVMRQKEENVMERMGLKR